METTAPQATHTTDTTKMCPGIALRSAAVTAAEATDTTDTTIWKPKDT